MTLIAPYPPYPSPSARSALDGRSDEQTIGPGSKGEPPVVPAASTMREPCATLAGMIDKFVHSMTAAMADIADGSTVLLGGFGDVGIPTPLLDGLIAEGV